MDPGQRIRGSGCCQRAWALASLRSVALPPILTKQKKKSRNNFFKKFPDIFKINIYWKLQKSDLVLES